MSRKPKLRLKTTSLIGTLVSYAKGRNFLLQPGGPPHAPWVATPWPHVQAYPDLLRAPEEAQIRVPPAQIRPLWQEFGLVPEKEETG